MTSAMNEVEAVAPLVSATTVPSNMDAATAVEVDLEGVQVRDAVHLFLCRIIDPTSHLTHFLLPDMTTQEHEIHANDGNDHLVEEDMAHLITQGTLQYIVEQIERIATCSDWATCVIR